jgi:hypothetical protein
MPEKYTFKTVDSSLTHRNGQRATILRTITEPEEGFDAEVLPMHRIQFEDGATAYCWTDELTPTED